MTQGIPGQGPQGASSTWRDLARRSVAAASDLVAEQARQMRVLVPDVAADITSAIQSEVPAYSGRRTGRHEMIEQAVAAALNQFLDSIDGAPHRDRGVDDIFRTLGKTETTHSETLTAFHAALQVATKRSWDHPRQLDIHLPAGATTRGELADALFAYIEHLSHEVERGFDLGQRTFRGNISARTRLAEQLLSGRPLAEPGIDPGIDPEVWAIPDSIIVAVAEPEGHDAPDLSAIAGTSLIVQRQQRLIVIADADNQDAVTAAFGGAGSRIAVSWPIEATAAPAGYRWARRALDLVRRGVIPDQPVIECREHRTQIWLHSEPALRQRLCQDLLKPLLAETPNSREILSETLLTWLETRDSAPAIAAKLGVHPQTVRYRWKRINELFGEDLHDPEFTIQITMLLKASVPLWKAGDQSDFELFRAEEDG